MLSLGIEASRALAMALARVALASGSPPPSRAATLIARASLVNCWPRRASTTAFLCLIECHLLCPDTPIKSRYAASDGRDRQSRDLQGLRRSRRLRRRHRRRGRTADRAG